MVFALGSAGDFPGGFFVDFFDDFAMASLKRTVEDLSIRHPCPLAAINLCRCENPLPALPGDQKNDLYTQYVVLLLPRLRKCCYGRMAS